MTEILRGGKANGAQVKPISLITKGGKGPMTGSVELKSHRRENSLKTHTMWVSTAPAASPGAHWVQRGPREQKG